MDPLEQLAAALDLEAPTRQETASVLDLARDVAHGTERRITPLATLLLGMSVQRRIAEGATRSDALDAAIADLRAALPPVPGTGRLGPSGTSGVRWAEPWSARSRPRCPPPAR